MPYRPQWILVWKVTNRDLYYGPFATHIEANLFATEHLTIYPDRTGCEVRLIHHPSFLTDDETQTQTQAT